MPTPVIMPKFEMAQESGTVLAWLKNEGDPVEKGEAILEVETDKVTMEVEAPAAGTLVGIMAGAGAVVPIGQPVAYILRAGESWAGAAPVGAAPESKPTTTSAAPPRLGRATPVAERLAASHGIDLHAVAPANRAGRVTKADVEAFLAVQRTVSSPADGKMRAVPAAKRLARELGIDLKTVAGSGPDGRIQSEDVRRAAAVVAAPAVPAEPTVVEAPQQAPPSLLAAGQPTVRRVVPLTSVRRAIAQRMVASVREAPQFTVSIDVDMGRAMQIVEDWRSAPELSDGARVTLTAFLVKACAWSLLRHPAINASLDGENLLEWAEVNIGVAVAVEDGLVVPVLRGADRMGIREVAARLADLTARARGGRLRLEDIQGGTFTISNLGMFGIDHFTAILNPPQAAILAVGRVTKRALVGEDDRVIVRPMATLTATGDHRVVDGATVAQFLRAVQRAIEHPGLLLEVGT